MLTQIDDEIIALVSLENKALDHWLVFTIFNCIQNIEFEWLLNEVNITIKQIYDIIVVSIESSIIGNVCITILVT